MNDKLMFTENAKLGGYLANFTIQPRGYIAKNILFGLTTARLVCCCRQNNMKQRDRNLPQPTTLMDCDHVPPLLLVVQIYAKYVIFIVVRNVSSITAITEKTKKF
uniref:Uncharacterized protein n=1 Tax=Romanomermis culicivorax TaxID=13658 RepID=A0A915I9E6_ROMCU